MTSDDRHRTSVRRPGRFAGPSASPTATSAWLADTVDAAALLYLAACARGRIPTTVVVNRHTYQQIVHVKARELGRGNPVMLLDMTVVPSDDVAVGEPQVE